ncbi:MAG: hypothetical protein HQL50_10445 [Magnetococcales bacterium]|nr:hypothetical protein [Magnetococcales bacterium]
MTNQDSSHARPLPRWIRNRWPDLQLFGWLLFFGIILYGGYELQYLADLQADILLAGTILLGIVFIVGLLTPALEGGCDCHHDHDHDHTDSRGLFPKLLESLGHFAPLLIFATVGVTTLTPTGSINPFATMRLAGPGSQQSLPDLSTLEPGSYYSANLTQFYATDAFDDNAPVAVVGRLLTLSDEDRQRLYPDKQGTITLIYRHAIACCAADASPVGAALSNLPADHGIPDNAWIRVEGRTALFSEQPRMLSIKVESIKRVPEPDRVYLNWLQVL